MAKYRFHIGVSALLVALLSVTSASKVAAQDDGPTMTDPRLGVKSSASGLTTPISLAFLGPNDWFVLEKDTGKVQWFVNGSLQSTVLDLAVNFGSERGLLGIALHPSFPDDPGVYLFWTCRSLTAPADPFYPDQRECSNDNMLGEDTNAIPEVPLLGNRVDRFVWDESTSTLTFDRNLIMLRAFQNDAAPEPPDQGDESQPPRGNHNAGVLAFGPDGKLYILYGDQGRRGQLQNLPSGPTETGLGPTVPDDQFGGPQPDDAHLAGVILRLNDDGSTPTDNPFYEAGAAQGGEVDENIQKIFAYGLRNSFGMAFDPLTGHLWAQENGEDAFDELNLVEPGLNSGWIQITGPLDRLSEYKSIETTSTNNEDFPNLQQFRWGPERIADSQDEAKSRMFMLPGAHYSDPEFSWKHVVAPAGIGFVNSRALGRAFIGDLFMGLSVPFPEGGPLFRFRITADGKRVAVNDPRLRDRVADNIDFNELTESESLLIGKNFGVVTDIKTGPNGNLFIVSLSQGAIYEIYRVRNANQQTEADGYKE